MIQHESGQFDDAKHFVRCWGYSDQVTPGKMKWKLEIIKKVYRTISLNEVNNEPSRVDLNILRGWKLFRGKLKKTFARSEKSSEIKLISIDI